MARSKPVAKDVAVPVTVSSGAAVDVTYMFEYSKWLTIAGTLVGTWHIEVSNDNVNWVQSGANVTAAGVREITERTKYVRVRCSAFTSGVPVGSVYGVQSPAE